MMTRCSLAAVALLACVGMTPAAAQRDSTATVDRAYEALGPRVREVAENYLRTDCEIGEVGVALRALLQVADSAKPYLVAVQKEGPPSRVLGEFQRGLDNTWQARQEFLKTPDARELGQRSFEMMTAITRDQYMKEQQAGIQAKYRERAALGLRAMEGPARKK
jgi:hypothetical protein